MNFVRHTSRRPEIRWGQLAGQWVLAVASIVVGGGLGLWLIGADALSVAVILTAMAAGVTLAIALTARRQLKLPRDPE